MKRSQRRFSKSSDASRPAPLTEAQRAFAVVLGPCLVKEWVRQSVPRSPSVGNDTRK